MLREIALGIAFGVLFCGQAKPQEQPATTSPPVIDLHGQAVSPTNDAFAYSIEYYPLKEPKVVITGKVTDTKGMAIKNATVSLGAQWGGKPIFSVSTNENGLYTVVIVAGIQPPQLLYLRFEGIGYSTKVLPMFFGGGQFKVRVSLSPYLG